MFSSICKRALINFNSINHQKLLKKMISSYGLVYNEYGDPSKVLRYEEISKMIKTEISNDEILLQFMASPINPADINTIQGVYAVKPKLPAIGGNEGVAKVIKVGDNVKNVSLNDWVIPSLSAVGTWRTHAVLNSKDVIKIDNTIDLMSAAQLSVNPCTAYRMMKDFVSLKEGDTIIQNGANSAVGLFVIQLAKIWNINTINVVRDRPDLDQLKNRLESLGANVIITEEELRQKSVMEQHLKNLSKPKLALNCVGGRNASDCMRYLDLNGTMVTYGGMSKQPLTIPTSSLIFKDQKFHGYWITKWSQENRFNQERVDMLNYLCDLYKQNKLQTPESVEIRLNQYKENVEKVMKGFQNVKYVFVNK